MVLSDGKGGILSTLSTGIGNFSVAYNFNAISIALIVMSSSVCTNNDDACNQGKQASWVSSTLAGIVFAGAIFGQLTMGYVGDIIGRGRALGVTLFIAALSAFFSAVFALGSPVSIYSVIAFFRFCLGIGVGGVYPLSAAKAAEDAGNAATGKVDITAAGWAFAWQVPGSMAPWLLGLIFSYCENMSDALKWQLLLGLGSIPAAIVCGLTAYEDYAKQKEAKGKLNEENSVMSPLPVNHTDSPLFKNEEKKDESFDGKNPLQGSFSTAKRSISVLDQADLTNYALRVSMHKVNYRRKLIVTGGCWFFYDICVYGVALFSGDIIGTLLPPSDDVSSNSHIQAIAPLQLIAQSFGFPAMMLTIMALKYVNTRHMQMFGFFMIAFSFSLLAGVFYPLRRTNDTGVFCCYVLLYFWLQGGVGITTFVMPAQIYPMEIRSTYNGISAAMGKSGAFVGSFLFGLLASKTSYPTVMVLCAILAGLCIAITYFFLEPDYEYDPNASNKHKSSDIPNSKL